ncbi:hypothetical protein BDW59DRAFT_146745 [Aspergillus cavernicola]|uniref:Uncharacterized protein n=1 Tax=Aspergillus cavernicola TaxID=176166 RepID=A0ABR4IBE0_9EURO
MSDMAESRDSKLNEVVNIAPAGDILVVGPEKVTLRVETLILLMAAAYLFQNAQAFREITKALVLNYDGSYLALLRKDIESVMDWRVFGLLEEQRSFARLKLGDILLTGIHTGGCRYKCGWSSKYAYAYLQLLERQNLWPTGLGSISKAIERAMYCMHI